MIDQFGKCDARNLPHTWGDQPNRPWMWSEDKSDNIFWDRWEKSPVVNFFTPNDGVIVVNFKTKWLGSVQSYSSVLSYCPNDYHLNVDDRCGVNMEEIKMLWTAKRFKNFFNRTENDFKKLQFTNLEEKPYSNDELTDFEYFCQALKRQQFYPTAAFHMPINPPENWVFEEWSPDETIGYQRLVEEIAEHTTITQDSLVDWSNCLPNIQNIFEHIQNSKQRERLVQIVQEPENSHKKRM